MIPPQLLGIAGKIGIRGFAMIGMGVALAFYVWRCDNFSKENTELSDWKAATVSATRIASGRPKLGEGNVARQIIFLGGGLQKLRGKITELNTEANARAKSFEKSQREAQQEAVALERAARASQGQIDRLRALAAAGGQCAVPGELSEALGGL